MIGPGPAADCRLCGAPLERTFVDLGVSPLANSYLKADRLGAPEPRFPLHVFVCGECLLVQLPESERPAAIFGDYLYFSSFSESWLAHAAAFARRMIGERGLGPASLVMEAGSNDGYLLRCFVEAGVPVLGIDPAANVAEAARRRGVRTRVGFFGLAAARELAAEGLAADLLIGNNVLAHVPDLHDFVAGLRTALAPGGLISLEFPHLLRLMADSQFDTIYHEHFSYFSLMTVERALTRHGLEVSDVETLPTHGGSLRVFARHAGKSPSPQSPPAPGLERVRREEAEAGMGKLATYLGFEAQVRRVKEDLLAFLTDARARGRRVAGYGAPAKGNTLLNYCGVGPDLLPFTVDQSPHKQGLFLPGTHIPIRPPDAIREARPDYVLILPWNLKEEITAQMAHVREWGGRFVVPIPALTVLP